MSSLRTYGVGLLILALAGCAGRQKADSGYRELSAKVGTLERRLSQLETTQPDSFPRQGIGVTGVPVTTIEMDEETAQDAKVQVGITVSKPKTIDIQQALKNAGFYDGPVDGKMGPVTREAIRSFQKANSLETDGVVGKRTWEKLQSHLGLASAETAGPSSK